MLAKRWSSWVTCLFGLLLMLACTTYYQRYAGYYRAFENGQFDKAKRYLEHTQAPRRDQLLYYMNLGMAAFMAQHYEQANRYFEIAYRLGDDLSRNYFQEAAGILVDPNYAPYRGEDFELIMIHYYKALAWLKLGRYEEALVECRRVDIKLRLLASRYRSQYAYRQDAFFHLLMGLIYDANHDYNNAFIAYRNAWRSYKEIFEPLFGLKAPEQLRHDLLRTAYLSGLNEELSYFEQQFGMTYKPAEQPAQGELVLLWHSGLAPLKVERELFFVVQTMGGWAHFYNELYNWHFRFPIDRRQASSLSYMELFRVVLPGYQERPPVFSHAHIVYGTYNIALEPVQDVNALAFYSLQQRLGWELGAALLRMALRKAAEYNLARDSKELGRLTGWLLQGSQRADTRAWMTLPHTIHYARISLPAGRQSLRLQVRAATRGQDQRSYPLEFDIRPGELHFHYFHNLQVVQPLAHGYRP